MRSKHVSDLSEYLGLSRSISIVFSRFDRRRRSAPGSFSTAPNRLPHQRVLQLQLPYPPTQPIRVIAQRLAIGSGLRHGIPPFRSPAPPFHRRGTVSSNDAPHRRRRQVLRPPASAAYQTGTAPPRDAASPTVWEAWERRRHTVDRHAATVPGHCLVGYPRCSTTCFVDIGVEKYNSTARSRSSRLNTATILPLSLQENVRSPLPNLSEKMDFG